MKLNSPKASTTPVQSQVVHDQDVPEVAEKQTADLAPTGLRGASTSMNVGGPVAREADAPSEELLASSSEANGPAESISITDLPMENEKVENLKEGDLVDLESCPYL